ncbi:hypothetical protein [Propionispora vibrioides]|uniref:Uncharacterized protein n=1 Tax=Propionispora vibrioides TaxID=112903 RepID=A0A1H8XAV9_9FIRM|nr:hypothetical protein [Propionispora vibrioides]SEP36857.1 hypothetical protein SAMN04490178_12173 [Propionispora vibrioides]
MSYNEKLPMDDEYIASGPADIRENFRALKEDQIVDAGTLAGLAPGNSGGNIPLSNGVVNSGLNADKLDGLDAAAFASAAHIHAVATDSSNGFMSNTDKAKLNAIATGAEVNQNAFSSVLVGSTTIQADSVADTLEITAGANISLTSDATNDRVTIAVSGTVPSATTATIAAACTGNAATATKLATVRAINGVAFDGGSDIAIVDSTKAPISHASTSTTYGIATASSYGHAKASTDTPAAAGTAAVGTDNGLYARGDHVHPAQTDIAGKAATATTAYNIPNSDVGGNIWIA